MQREVPPAAAREFLNSSLRRGLFITAGHARLRVEPDGSSHSLHSSRYGKILFGRGAVEPFKVQAGVIVSQRSREMRVRVSPGVLGFSTSGPEAIQASHSFRLTGAECSGFLRTSRFTNRSDSVLRFRVIALQDPTSLNFRSDRDPPADIGVNAFNRGDHVVMDDVGDTTGVRLVGLNPRPSAVYLTRSKQRALDLLSAGELPESTAGMSGPILILSQHDVELPPGGSFELELTSLYHPSSLETALSEMKDRRIRGAGAAPRPAFFRCSSPSIDFASAWATSALDGLEREQDLLERLSAGFGESLLRPAVFEKGFLELKGVQRRDGLLPHSGGGAGGPMETSLFVINACRYLGMKADKKLARRWYPSLRKAGNGLRTAAAEGLIRTQPGRPDGWRRRLGSGFPTGQLSEVNLVASRALADLASLSAQLGKEGDSSAFRETGARIQSEVSRRLRDIETGNLALNMDPKGRLHAEATVDQAVALAFAAPDPSPASSVVHRLLEKDFETGYGPRTVPKSNNLYYSADYGEGQLGGCWTRASLSHALLAYSSGHAAIGSSALEKVASLVSSEWERLGGVPGEFPYWFDPERRLIGSTGSDPVAASRFLEVLLSGELGMKASLGGTRFEVPAESSLRWLLVRGLREGDGGALFVGRHAAGPLVVTSLEHTEAAGATRLLGGERLDLSPGLECSVFWDRSSVLACVGNAADSASSDALRIPMRGKPLSTALFVDLAEFDPDRPQWVVTGRRKLLDVLELRAEVKPGSWKAYRASQISGPAQITS